MEGWQIEAVRRFHRLDVYLGKQEVKYDQVSSQKGVCVCARARVCVCVRV